MTLQQSRVIARKIHLFIAFLQMIYIYSPAHNFAVVQQVVRWGTFPLLIISGVWLTFGGKITDFVQRRKATMPFS
ncbi:MAG: hypothetical protein ACK5QX_05125 [bacterium]|jgi:hypothetical protein